MNAIIDEHNLVTYTIIDTATGTIISTSGPQDTPLVVWFRSAYKNDAERSAITDAANHVESSALCSVLKSETWLNLASSISFKPSLIIFHYKMILHPVVSVPEFVNMVTTLFRYINPDDKKLRIAVSVDKTCGIDFIKELQTTEVVGIVPCIDDFGLTALTTGINSLLNQPTYWPKELINTLAGAKKECESSFHLTNRQQQVLSLVCNRGLSNKKIASILKISESTVKIHISAILKEYGVRNRTQLALAASSSLKA